MASPDALAFIDRQDIEERIGSPVRSAYRLPCDPRPPRADAVIVAPATYNSVCKIYLGVADTYALSLAAEAIGLGIPVLIAPYVNSALARRRPYVEAISGLRAEGAHVVLTDLPPAIWNGPLEEYPWELVASNFEKIISVGRPAAGEPINSDSASSPEIDSGT